jgi:hypothetical protein
MSDGLGPLNLSDADLKGFDAVESGRYNAEIVALTVDAVKNASGTGKMPAGTPMIKVQFRLLSNLEGISEGIENRRVFASYVIPPKDYDAKKAAVMKGMVARLFMALGDSEDEVRAKNFNPDLDDYVGRECVVTVGREPKKDQAGNTIEGEFNNPVKGVKAPGEVSAGGLL